MLFAHLTIFFIVRFRLTRKKKQLEKDKAQLYIENQQLQGKLNTYEAIISDFYDGSENE